MFIFYVFPIVCDYYFNSAYSTQFNILNFFSESVAAVSSPEPEEAEPESHGDDAPLSSESEAPLSERAAEGHEGSIFSASPDRRVQFDIGKHSLINF